MGEEIVASKMEVELKKKKWRKKRSTTPIWCGIMSETSYSLLIFVIFLATIYSSF